MADDKCCIEITIDESPIQIVIEENILQPTITENQIIIDMFDSTAVDVQVKEEIINVNFPPQDLVGPQGPAGRGVAILGVNDDPCGVNTTLGPTLVLKAVEVDGCTKYKVLIVSENNG